MAMKWICDQTGTEVENNDWNDARYAPAIPDGWVQLHEQQSDGSYIVRHFSSSDEYKNWRDAQ